MKVNLSDHFDYKKIIRFTLPTIGTMIFTSVYAVVDGLFISNVVGSEPFAAVNLIIPVTMILGAFGFMMGTGGSALVSMKLGQGEKEQANQYFSLLVYLMIIVGILFAVVGNIFLPQIARLIGADDAMMDDCVTYGRILMAALPAFMLQNSFQSFLVVAEKPRLGFGITALAGFTNMLLDFFFVYVLCLGVRGAALATAISQIVGAFIPIIYFLQKNDRVLHLVRTKIHMQAIWKSCFNGSSEMVSNIAMSLVNMLYNIQLMKLAGADGVVAYGVIMYVGFIFVGSYIGYSVGIAPVISFHYGAKNIDELKSLFSKSLKLIVVVSITMTLLAEFSAGMLASIFVSYDSELLVMTTNAIRLFSLSYFISGINIFASSFFTALNNGFISALLSFLRTFVFLVIAIFAAPIFLGVNGIWLAVVFAEGLALGATIICFITNRKKYKYL